MSKFRKLDCNSSKAAVEERGKKVLELKISQVPILAYTLMYTGVDGEDLARKMKWLDNAILGMTEWRDVMDEHPELSNAFAFLCDERLFLRKLLMQILTAIDAPKADSKYGDMSIGDEIKEEEGGKA